MDHWCFKTMLVKFLQTLQPLLRLKLILILDSNFSFSLEKEIFIFATLLSKQRHYTDDIEPSTTVQQE